ncbi:hypothetical protein [Streptomyces sp. TP-A0874]|uniref:hypothetical protein n=1 Tax=Streptomyces sp. TP-A0874 TaxID=549819 RepID=UPI00085361CA|nr:hypothetical protein [Streptomyces sp. TP-A0874]
MKKIVMRAAVAVLALALSLLASPATAQDLAGAAENVTTVTHDTRGAAAKLSHSQAMSQLNAAGIGVTSSGGCTDRNKPNCTSLDQVNSETIAGVITLKSASGCAITITGGTETGHADGTYSHWNGYKLDLSMTSCLTNYITSAFTSIGGSKWQSAAGNIYYNEVNHWDVTFYNCGGC